MTSTGPTSTNPTSAGTAPALASPNLQQIQHIVVLMLENRSFDHMLGFLYADDGNVSPKGDPFEGLTGTESNKDASGNPVAVLAASQSTPNLYYLPGADPGEGFLATNDQLFGSTTGGSAPDNSGFVIDYAYTLGWESKTPGWTILPGTQPSDIMTMYTPATLPVLSALARGFAVCDHWYASLPTETLPNRAFALAATSQGHMDDKTKTFTCPSIFGLLSAHGVSWSVFGYDAPPLTRHNFPDITSADESHFGLFSDFKTAAAAGTLPSFTFLEPGWSSTGNSEHPNYDVASGEQLVLDVYNAVRQGPGWEATLLVVTYDEHGGCYDHVPPPAGAVAPDNSAGEYGFTFDRFGVRVPTVLVSPLIHAGTVFRVPPGSVPLDHTSVLKTMEMRWGLPSLTARDAAAPDFSAVLNLTTPRTDDPLAGVSAPVNNQANPSAGIPSHLQEVHAELVSRLPVTSDKQLADLRTASDFHDYILQREQAWRDMKVSGQPGNRPQAR